jgi:N-methylhydantoinase A
MLMTDLRQDLVRTRVMACNASTWPTVLASLEDLCRVAAESFSTEQQAHVTRTWLQRSVDLRYAGQEHTVRSPIDCGEPTSALLERFHGLHERAYAFRLDEEVEVVNLHVTVWGEVPKPDVQSRAVGSRSLDEARKGRRGVLFEESGWVETPVFERGLLPVGRTVCGPAIVEEPSSTTVVLAGQSCCDAFSHLSSSKEGLDGGAAVDPFTVCHQGR